MPCYNEAEVIGQTHARLSAALDGLAALRCEIVFVNDGSTDDTGRLLDELAARDARARVLHLSRNFGHQIAITAGTDDARGDAVVIMDADLQDPPEVIERFVDEWRNGHHVVYGVRSDRSEDTWFKRSTASLFYRLINRVAETPVPFGAGDFRLMDRVVVDALGAMPERDRFVRGMVSWVGFNQVAVPYERPPRLAGTTKYPFPKMLRFAANALVSFSFTPLRIATLLGFLASILSLVGIVWALVLRFTGQTVQGWTTILVAVLFLGGIQLMALGMIGEYVGRSYREVKRRPLYFIARRTGFVGSQDARPLERGSRQVKR